MKIDSEKKVNQSELDAYVDGRLSDDESHRIKALLDHDAAAAKYIEDALKLNKMLGEYTHKIDYAPTSQGILDSLERLKPMPNAQVISLAERFLTMRSLQALAAGLFILTIGYAGGFFMAGHKNEQQALAVQQVRDQVREEVQRAMNNTLEYRPSGEQVTWKSKNGKASAELMPVRTFKTPNQRYCREFQETLIIDGVREERRGLACRVGKEDWKTRMLLARGEKSGVF